MQLMAGNRYFEVMQDYEEGMRAGMKGYLMCGKAIAAIKEEGLWKLDGGHVKSFAHWVKNTLHISPSQAHRMSQIYREVGELLSKPELAQDITKVTLLLPLLKDQTPEKKEEMLLEARDLTIEALRNNILERQGRSDEATDVCDHPMDMLEDWTRCKKCGKFLR